MKYTIIFLFAMITFSISSCTSLKGGKPTIKQGVFGRVLWKEGNAMPSLGGPKISDGKPVPRVVQIYEVAKASDADGQSPLFRSIKTKLIATVRTNAEGYFQYELALGSYSIFTVEEDGQLFSSLGNMNGEIGSFEVKANEVTHYNIVVNYKAFY